MKKQFAVIGLGRFGSSVVETLHSLGHDILAIDNDEEKVQRVSEFCTHAVQADGSDENALKSLGIRNFDVVVVAIGEDIQSSILTTLLMKELGVPKVVVKAQNDAHGKVLLKIGADEVIFPERDMGIRVANHLVSTNILDYIELAPDYSIIEFAATDNMVGKTLRQLDLRAKLGINVLAIKRGEKVNISPKADDLIDEGDILIIIGANKDIQKVQEQR